MQLIGIVGVIALVGLMSISGFQIMPESATNRAAASESDGSLTTSESPYGVTTTGARTTTQPSTPAVTTPAALIAPAVITALAPQNIESTSALLRGEVVVGTDTIGDVFFIYGYDKLDIDRSLGSFTTYEQVLANKRVEAVVTRVATSLTRDREITTRVSKLAPDTAYYVRLCAERGDRLSCAPTTSFTTTPRAYSVSDVRVPTIRVRQETAGAADEMVLDITVAMQDTNTGDVYLIYGESQTRVENASARSYNRISEDDEQLQTTRVIRTIRGTQRLIETIDDLEADTLIYYVACVEYDGLRDGRVCTRTQSYRTHDEDYGATPLIEAGSVVAVGTTARLSGRVSMQPFNSGKVFFVYGTDISRIAALGGETTMERLRQTQDRFQRVLVDADLDGSDTYVQSVQDLLPNTAYVARLCVEYTNQNENYREVAFVACGATRSLTTL